jgi:sugar phosphate permease
VLRAAHHGNLRSGAQRIVRYCRHDTPAVWRKMLGETKAQETIVPHTASGLSSRRWLRLLPAIFITYSFAYVDRANYGFGAAAGMAHDLHIDAGAVSLLGALFFLGYFFFQIPGAAYAERRSAKRLVLWSMVAWGVLASATGLISNVPMLFVDRFLLGVVESAVLPSLLILLSHWFTGPERSRANTVLILGNPVTVLWMSIVSGYLTHSMGWRGMFIAEGVPSILWAAVWWWLVDETPRHASWLTPDARKAIETQLAKEQEAITPVRSYRKAFTTPAVILLSLQYLFWSIGVYGFVLWLPSMLKSGSQIGLVGIGWLSAGPYLAATILMLAVSAFSDRLRVRKGVVWPCMLAGAVAFYASFALGAAHYWVSYALLVVSGAAMYAPYGPFFAWMTELLPRNVAGGAMALVNSCGALGSFVGTYVVGFLNGATGGDGASYLFMAASLLAATLLTLAVRRSTAEVRLGAPVVAHR